MGKKLTIKLLGRVTIELDGKPVRGLSSRKAEALLIYLVCQKRPFSRDVLAEFLWDDREQDQSMANLRSLLSGLRRSLGAFLSISRQSVSFNLDSDYELDVDAFVAHLEPLKNQDVVQLTSNHIAEIETAVSHYYGAFLEGFYIRESRRFDEWLTVERERYQRLAVNGWQQLIRTHLQNGNYPAGIEHGVRLLETDPLNENGHRQMMLLLAKNNQRHTALQQYDTCVRVLDEELGVPPSAETTRLYEQIRASQASPLHNLLPQTTAFVGRDSELAELKRMLEWQNGRFITLLGPGGIGKTRLALQFAQQIVTNQPGLFLNGLRFISLTSLETPQYLVAKIADALDFQLRGSKPPVQQLVNYLQSREMLLIIDNFDRLAVDKTAVDLLATLIQQCPQLKLIVTSRVRLHLPDEAVFDMRGLQFPRQQTYVAVENYAAVQLFIQNARRYLHGFQPSPDDIEAIIQTCRLLDGMPLGIELASAWVRFLSCQEIVADLSQNLDLLEEAGEEVVGQRHSLRAAFERSWELLPNNVRRTLTQLALFRGSFSREAAKEIAEASLSHLVRLMDNSWLRRLEADGQVRFDMLSIMRQYAVGKLGEFEGVETAVIRRFIHFYGDFLAQHTKPLEGGNQQQTLNEIATEIENIRYAISLALHAQNLAPIAKAVDSLFYFYDTRSQFLAGATLFQQMIDSLQKFPDSTEKRITLAKSQARLGWFLFHQGAYDDSRHLLQTSLDSLRNEGAMQEAAFSLNYLGAVMRHFGDYPTAEAMLQEALAIAQANNNEFEASISLNILGQVASLQGDYALANDLCRQSRVLKQKVGDRWGMSHSLTYLGRVAQALGEHDEARALFEQSLAISEDFADRRGVAFAYQNLGDVALWGLDYETAVSQYNKSLQLYREIADQLGVAFTLAKQGQAMALQNEVAKARRQLVETLRAALELGSVPVMIEGILGTAVLQFQTKASETSAQYLAYVIKHDGSNQAQIERATHLLAEWSLTPADEPLNEISDFVQQIVSKESALVLV